MPFGTLPFELLSKVLEHHDHNLEDCTTAKTRLKQTLTMGQIDRRMRHVALHHKPLWSTIYLEWSKETVELYLLRSKHANDSTIYVYLDTRGRGTSHMKANLERWADFLRTQMKNIVFLNLHIQNSHGVKAIADAVNTPAPALHTAIINLGERIRSINQLFDSHAPNLVSATMRSGLSFNLTSFTALQTLVSNVGPENIAQLLESMPQMPSLEDITLIGLPDLVDLPPIPTDPFVLESCRRLNMKRIHAHCVLYLLHSLSLPNLSALSVREEVVVMNNALTLMAINHLDPRYSLSVAFSTPTATPEALHLEIHPTRLLVSFRGFEFASDWYDLDAVLDDEMVDAIHRAVAAPATFIGLQPGRLVITDRISGQHSAHPLSLKVQHLRTMLRVVFVTYSSILELDLIDKMGRTVEVLLSQNQDYLPCLSKIRVIEKSQGAEGEILDGAMNALSRLGRNRGVVTSYRRLSA
ncbi:hypothetical protein SISSUDRAFT_1127683 [Sistotremastrum suecicum HHB10207 ss-3]|uniref:F-box domain-containing protein n=1 Tax=Sistotremastrum suecicum HHB10207 ss-3 TaxID=1314776 RepID=A0A166EUS4_9AGAM|nr:hypothetical protein SISSUDRAFT_1127683 [Sistotremastrum suecicum HHB10207 ss-3]